MNYFLIKFCIIVIVIIPFSISLLLAEDVIKLNEGGEIRGKIIEENDYFVKVETKNGTVEISRDDIASIQKGFDFDTEFKKRKSKLSPNDAEGFYKLGLWCEENKHEKEAIECYEEAIKIDPEHVPSRQKLNYKKLKGKWLKEEDYYKEIGWVNYGGVWMPQEDKEKYEAGLVKREDGTWISKKEWDEEQKKIGGKPKPKPSETPANGKAPKPGETPRESPDDTGDPAAAERLKMRKQRNPVPEDKEKRKDWIQQQLSNWNNYYESKHYVFLSNAPAEKTQYYAKIMDKMYEEYCRIFAYKEEQKSPFLVTMYGSQREFMQKDRKGPGVGGYYDGSKIVCFFGQVGALSTQVVLFHEGTHQFQGLIWPDMDEFTVKPGGIWMIEGLATYFECSEFYEGKLETGLVNKGRIGTLRSAMATNRYTRLPDLIRMTQAGYSAFHYAHGWGACYFFIHADKKLLSKFKEYFKEFKKTGIDPVATFQRIFCTGGMDEEKLDKAWRDYIMNLPAR